MSDDTIDASCVKCGKLIFTMSHPPRAHVEFFHVGRLRDRKEGLVYDFICDCGHHGKILILANLVPHDSNGN